MQNLIFILILNILTNINPVKVNNNFDLTININNVPSDKGQILVYLYNNKKDFPKHPTLKKNTEIKSNTARITFNNLEKGHYAFVVIHDKNKNNKMDFNLLHLPKEKSTISNNAKRFFGPPKFSDASFLLEKDTQITIDFSKSSKKKKHKSH